MLSDWQLTKPDRARSKFFNSPDDIDISSVHSGSSNCRPKFSCRVYLR